MGLYSPGRRRAIIILVLTSILLITIDQRGNSLLNAARSAWVQALRPFESAAEVVGRPVQNAWRGITDYDRLAEENAKLRDQVASGQADVISARSVLAQLQSLQADAGLDTIGDYGTVTVRVVGPSPNNLDQIIEVDKGTNDNLQNGMPVVASGFLIGKITNVSRDRALIRLITDVQYRVGVKIVQPSGPISEARFVTTTSTTTTTTTSTVPVETTPDGSIVVAPSTIAPPIPTPPAASPTNPPPSTSVAAATGDTTTSTSSTTSTTVAPEPFRETGILRGRGAGNFPNVVLVEDTAGPRRPQVGDVVQTAGGETGLAPPDLLIGVVSKVDMISPAEGLEINVQPFSSISSLEFVTIVLYRPAGELGTGDSD